MIVKKLRALEFLICGILFLLLFGGCAKRKADPPGIYLTDGGRGCLEILKDASRGLRIGRELATFLPSGSLSRWAVSFKNQKLVFLDETKWGREDEWESRHFYEMVPSSSTPGDWDLVRADWWDGLSKKRRSDEEIPPLEQPIPSFLHRVDDRRVFEYFNLLRDYYEAVVEKKNLGAELNIDRLSELAARLMESHLDDLYVRTLYLDVLLRKGDYETLEKKLNEWREVYSRAENAFVRWAFIEAENTLQAVELSAAGRNAYDFITQTLSPVTNLETRLELFPKILEYKDFLQQRDSLIMSIPRYWDYQIAAKTLRVEAEFMILEGKPEKREEALKILAAIYHFGQLLNQSDTVINRLMGMAIRGIGCAGLGHYILNCCKTQEEFLQLWQMLGDLDTKRGEKIFAESLLLPFEKEEYKIWQRVADVHFQLVRMGTAAKYRFLTHQAFPGSAEEFAPLLPEGPPQDPFSLEPLKFLAGPESFTCYSIGPDQRDNRTAVSYDPTNGTVSGGDITFEIPH